MYRLRDETEKARAEEAYNYATEGKVVTVISSGDAGIYGIPAYLRDETRKGSDISIEALPESVPSRRQPPLLGAPVGHDFCVISLSDLMTPWELIENASKPPLRQTLSPPSIIPK